MKSRLFLAASIFSFTLAMFITPRITSAQVQPSTPQPFKIQLVDLDSRNPLGVGFRTAQGRLTAAVDGIVCATVNAAEPSPPVLVIGLAGQPEACRRVGARITLMNERGGELFEHFVLRPGETVQLGNYGPMPARTGAGLAVTGNEFAGGRSLSLAAIALSIGGLMLLAAGRLATRAKQAR